MARRFQDADDDDPIFLTHAPGSLSSEEERERRRRSEAIEARRKAKAEEQARKQKKKKKRKRKPLTAVFTRTAFGERRAAAARKRTGEAERPKPKPKRKPKPTPKPTPPRQPDLNETWRGFRRPKPRRPEKPEPTEPRRRKPITQRFTTRVRGGGRRLGDGLVRLGQTAGWGALDRTLGAARAVRRRREALAPRPTPVSRPPLLLPALVGGLLRPLAPSGLLTVGLMAAFLASAILLLWFLPPVGVVAGVLALSTFATLRLKAVVDVGHGRDDLEWPEWEESMAGVSVHAGLLLLFAPALILAWLAAGPDPWNDPQGIPAQARRLVAPQQDHAVARAAADVGEAYQKKVWSSHDLVREQRRAVGVSEGDEGEERRRAQARRQVEGLKQMAGEAPPPAAVARDKSPGAAASRVTRETLWKLRGWLDPRGHTGRPFAARVCFLAALFLFPMALLTAATLKSAYAALYPPLLIGSILRAPIAYLLTLAAVLALDLGLVLAVALPYPVALTLVTDAGSARVAAVAAAAFGVVALGLAGACVVGRFYRCRSDVFGW